MAIPFHLLLIHSKKSICIWTCDTHMEISSLIGWHPPFWDICRTRFPFVFFPLTAIAFHFLPIINPIRVNINVVIISGRFSSGFCYFHSVSTAIRWKFRTFHLEIDRRLFCDHRRRCVAGTKVGMLMVGGVRWNCDLVAIIVSYRIGPDSKVLRIILKMANGFSQCFFFNFHFRGCYK